MAPVGKELEDKLKGFREELIKLNEGTKRSLEKHIKRTNPLLDEKENMKERLEKEIEINDFLIDVVESLLNNNFGIKS